MQAKLKRSTKIKNDYNCPVHQKSHKVIVTIKHRGGERSQRKDATLLMISRRNNRMESLHSAISNNTESKAPIEA